MRGLARSLAFFTTMITVFLAVDVILGLYMPYQRLNQTAPGQLPSVYLFWGIPLGVALLAFLAARELTWPHTRRALLVGALFALCVTIGLGFMIAVEGGFIATCTNPASQSFCYLVPPSSQDPEYFFLYGSVVLWAAGIFFSVLTAGTALGVALMSTRAMRQI